VKDLRKTPATLSLQPSSDLPPDHMKMVKDIYNPFLHIMDYVDNLKIPAPG
jgi:hypothetical protein